VQWRESEGVRWLEAEVGRATAAFSTRLGGRSEPPFDSLNLGILTEDQPEAVLANRRGLAAALGLPPGSIAIARQVHGAGLLEHAGAQQPSPFAAPGSPIAEADGHITAQPGLAPLVFVADCLPVVLAGPRGVAVLHCGWRGLAAGILARGAEAVAATDAAIGPGIGPCCDVEGEEVLAEFAPLGPDLCAEGRRLDLPEVARRLLADAGVGRVQSAGLCTSCEEGLFFSHRRDAGRTGRQAGLAWIEAG
jgi:YfiH family protein